MEHEEEEERELNDGYEDNRIESTPGLFLEFERRKPLKKISEKDNGLNSKAIEAKRLYEGNVLQRFEIIAEGNFRAEKSGSQKKLADRKGRAATEGSEE